MMRKRLTTTLLASLGASLFGALAWTAIAQSYGTITVINNSSLTIPQTRVYKQCLGAFGAQVFGSLASGQSSSQDMTAPVQGCAWAREVGIEPYYISCATANSVPPGASLVTVVWEGTNADNLHCTITAQ